MISTPLSRKSKTEDKGFGKWKRIFRDLYPFHRPEYFLIAGPQGLCFFSIVPGRNVTLIDERYATDIDDRTIADFLKNLRLKGNYFGQEVTLLIPEPAAYTILRMKEKTDFDHLREECQELVRDAVKPRILSAALFGDSWYIVEGLDEEYVKKTLGLIAENGLLVHRIMSLAGFVLSGACGSGNDPIPRSSIVELGHYASIFSINKNDRSFYYEVCDSDNEPVDGKNLLRLKKVADAGNSGNQLILFSNRPGSGRNPQESGSQRPKTLKEFFRFSVHRKGTSEFSLKEYVVSEIRYCLVTANSARLAVFIMMSLLLAASVIAITLSGLRKDSQDLYDRYQDKLARIYSVEKELAGVRDKIASIDSGYLTPKGFGGHVTRFCQKIPPDVYLTSLQCRRTSESSLQVLAQGRAGRETSVFKYKEYLVEFSGNMVYEIKSISQLAPQAVGPDSLSYQFILGTE